MCRRGIKAWPEEPRKLPEVCRRLTPSSLPSLLAGARCSRICGSGSRASHSLRSTACRSSCAAGGARPRGSGPHGGRGRGGLRRLRDRRLHLDVKTAPYHHPLLGCGRVWSGKGGDTLNTGSVIGDVQ